MSDENGKELQEQESSGLMPSDLREFKRVIKPIEAAAKTEADVAALPEKLDKKQRVYWAHRLDHLHDDLYAAEKEIGRSRAETLFLMQRYEFFRELDFTSFNQYVEFKYGTSKWSYSLEKGFELSYRFGIDEEHELYDDLLLIKNKQLLEKINTVATEENVGMLIEKAAAKEIDVYVMREATRQIDERDWSQPVVLEGLLEAAIKEVQPFTMPALD